MKKRRNALRAYLSGGMEYANNEGADWRYDLEAWIKKNLRHSVFNPNHESEKYLSKKHPGANLRALKTENVDAFTRIVRGIVDLDSREVAYHSDYIICLWDRSAAKGAGTKGELTLAKFFRKPVYMVTKMKKENIAGWVLGCTTIMFSSFDELKSFLLKEYGALSTKHMKEERR